jgi:hypothetical protein
LAKPGPIATPWTTTCPPWNSTSDPKKARAETKELEIDNYQNPWKLVDVLDRSKK